MALLDQVVISGTMFCLNLVLIEQTTPEAYGRFILIFSLHLLAFSAQNALVLTPINVLLPGKSDRQQRVTLRMLSTIDIGVVGIAAVVVALLVAAFQFTWVYCIGAFLLVVGASARELHRTIFQTKQSNYQMVLLDGVAMAFSALLLFQFWPYAAPELAAIYALAGGNLLAVLTCTRSANRTPWRLLDMVDRYRSYWKKSRWALIGAGLTNTHLRFYVFVVEIARGSAALGILYTGRVLINPVSLLAFSWARASRPMIAAQLAANDGKAVFRTLLLGTLSIAALGIFYIVCLHSLWPHIEPRLSGGHGAEIGALLWLWSIFGLVSLPSECISAYLQAAHRYRELTLLDSASVLTSSILLMGLFLGFDISSAIWALIVGELVMAAIMITMVWRDFSGAKGQAGDIDLVSPS